MVKIQKKWETTYFTLNKQTVELTVDFENNTYKICNGHEESLSFDGDTTDMTKDKIEILKTILKYLKYNLGFK